MGAKANLLIWLYNAIHDPAPRLVVVSETGRAATIPVIAIDRYC